MGAAHGGAHAEEIRKYTNDRVELVASGLWSGGPLARSEVLEIAESMLPAHEAFDAALHEEMLAMADSAGITPAEAVVVGGFTDFVDTVRAVVGGPMPESVIEDDCTAMIVPNHRAGGHGILGQTWDMHDDATDHVVLLRIAPDDSPAALVFTTTGCLGQIGMNSEGVCVGINNLVGLDGTRGVNWTSVVRGMLKTSSAAEARDVLLAADLAGAHNFLIFDKHGVGFDVEAMPSARPVLELGETPIVHTNHTVLPESSAVQAEKAPGLMDSSQSRYDTAVELLADGDIDVERVFEITRDPGAICQSPVPPYNIESSGAAVMRPSTLEFWACWGQPIANEYEKIEFPHSPDSAASAHINHAGLDGSSGVAGRESAHINQLVAIGPTSGLQYVRMTKSMCKAMEALELEAFPTADPADLYDEQSLLILAEEFPEGSVVGFDGDDRADPVAVGLGVRTQFDFDHPQHVLKELLADAPTESGDDPDAPWYYGTDIVVRPDYRRRGIGRELYDLRKQMCIDLNLAGIVAGGVIPGYAEHKDVLSADDYVAKVVAGELYDPTLTFQLENGFEAPCALADYIKDPAVNNFASLIVWHNPRYMPGAVDAATGGDRS